MTTVRAGHPSWTLLTAHRPARPWSVNRRRDAVTPPSSITAVATTNAGVPHRLQRLDPQAAAWLDWRQLRALPHQLTAQLRRDAAHRECAAATVRERQIAGQEPLRDTAGNGQLEGGDGQRGPARRGPRRARDVRNANGLAGACGRCVAW